MPELPIVPGTLGAGKYFSNASEVAFKRAVGIIFGQPAPFVHCGLAFGPVGKETNCVAVAVLPGQAPIPGPDVITVPPQGSTTAVVMAEKSPARSAAVGTVVVNAVPVRSRKPSQLKNQNVLSLPSYT